MIMPTKPSEGHAGKKKKIWPCSGGIIMPTKAPKETKMGWKILAVFLHACT
jgi:hypothetical protein